METLISILKRIGFKKEYAQIISQEYLAMPLTLPVSDEPMRRICEALTYCKLITEESCDGHGNKFPYITFHVEMHSDIYNIGHIINHQMINISNFEWGVELYSGGFLSRTDTPINYMLTLSDKSIDCKKEYKWIIEDLDIMGILAYSKLWCNKKQKEKSECEKTRLKSTEHRNIVMRLGDLNNLTPDYVGGKKITAEIYDHETTEILKHVALHKGMITETFTDGLEICGEGNLSVDGRHIHQLIIHFDSRNVILTYTMKNGCNNI